MESHGEQTHFVKRVVLPSGKTIEVVYFKDAGRPPPVAEPPVDGVAVDGVAEAPERSPAEPHQDLHVCVECSSELVYPVQWEESGEENWSVLLHCPNCDIYREGVFTQETVEGFDEELDRGADALARDYKRLMRANMAEEIERFVGALASDAILPEDF
jgi:hypothetical protein